MSRPSKKTFLSPWLLILITALSGFTFAPLYSPPYSPATFSYSLIHGSRLTIQGSTNVNEFTCFSEETYTKQSANVFINEGKNNITFDNVILKVKTESLGCGNEVMNKNLCQTLGGEKYPFIIVELEEVFTKDGQPANFVRWTQLIGKLYITLAGVRKSQQIDFTAKQNYDGVYHFIGEHKIALSQYNLAPPTALFGLVMVKDIINVKFDLLVSVNPTVL